MKFLHTCFHGTLYDITVFGLLFWAWNNPSLENAVYACNAFALALFYLDLTRIYSTCCTSVQAGRTLAHQERQESSPAAILLQTLPETFNFFPALYGSILKFRPGLYALASSAIICSSAAGLQYYWIIVVYITNLVLSAIVPAIAAQSFFHGLFSERRALSTEKSV